MNDSTGVRQSAATHVEVRERRARPRAAVIGSGVAGLVAALTLSETHEVTLYEAADRLGGHAHTHDLPGVHGEAPVPVDTGFIVLNDRTYPVLTSVFARLGVKVVPTEMSMSIREETSGMEYAGGRGWPGFVARPQQLLSPTYLRLLLEVKRFHAWGARFLAEADPDDTTTYGELIRDGRFREEFVRLYAVPVVACVWSTGTDDVLGYPARYLLQFLDHHGMLSIGNSPQWMTVEGGSRTYVQAIASRLDVVRTGCPVTHVRIAADAEGQTSEVQVVTASDTHSFDHVVIATHPDHALRVLAEPTAEQRRVLGAFRYSRNHVQLHRDASLLPRAHGARASWNYLVQREGTAPLVTYWMNRLQHLPSSHPAFVTLNGAHRVNPRQVVAEMEYEHPLYDVACVRAQTQLPGLNGPRLAFAGAYHGWGFHEDGARSGQAAARAVVGAAA